MIDNNECNVKRGGEKEYEIEGNFSTRKNKWIGQIPLDAFATARPQRDYSSSNWIHFHPDIVE